jgi:hypothetical protein
MVTLKYNHLPRPHEIFAKAPRQRLTLDQCKQEAQRIMAMTHLSKNTRNLLITKLYRDNGMA